MDLSRLPPPTAEHFRQSYGTPLDRSLYVTRGFLKPRYAPSPDGDMALKKNYVNELIQQISNTELPFRELVISNETLAEVAVSTHRDYTEEAAEDCLSELLSEDKFRVVYTSEARFADAAANFHSRSGKEPNFAEFIDRQVMDDEDIQHVVTWDSDFHSFAGVTMLPISYWGT